MVGNSGEPCVKVFLAEPVTTSAPAPDAPPAARLLGNRPNPFNPATEIAFALPASGSVTLTIHDAAGRHVRDLLVERPHAAGEHTVHWDGRDARGRPAPAGIYLARLHTETGHDIRRLALVK